MLGVSGGLLLPYMRSAAGGVALGALPCPARQPVCRHHESRGRLPCVLMLRLTVHGLLLLLLSLRAVSFTLTASTRAWCCVRLAILPPLHTS